MKILLLTRYGRLGASSRLRAYQYIPALTAAGFDVTISPLLSDAYLELSYNGKSSQWCGIPGVVTRVWTLLTARKYDLIWIEKEALPWVPGFIERLLMPSGIPYVVDYDDAVFHQYDLHRSRLVRALFGRKLDGIMRRATAVFVGNDYLAARARLAGSRHVVYVPTVLDPNHYKVRQRADWMAAKTAVIGWMGSPSTWKAHMRPMSDGLAALAIRKSAILQVVGAKTDPKVEGPLNFIPWAEDIEGELTAGFSVGIMPLPDDPWSKGKCGYKLLQYMASGIPVIASPVGVNTTIVEQGINGYFAITFEDWTHYIEALIDDPEKCFALGQHGREKIEQHYSIHVWGPKIADIFLKLKVNSSQR